MQTILFIDSNFILLDNFTEYFEKEGFNILTANTGQQGVALARVCLPDLIICEILMQGMDGYEVLRLVLDESVTFEIPFIFCTTKCETIDKAEGLRLGADDYMVKPIDMETMISIAKNRMVYGSSRQLCK